MCPRYHRKDPSEVESECEKEIRDHTPLDPSTRPVFRRSRPGDAASVFTPGGAKPVVARPDDDADDEQEDEDGTLAVLAAAPPPSRTLAPVELHRHLGRCARRGRPWRERR